MQLIATKAGPSDKYDRLRCVRDDGSETTVAMPRQGTLPHDLVHAVMESALGFSDGFIGLVAKGADIAFLSKSFHEYIDPVRHAQGAQAESAVESLQSQLWSGVFDEGAFRYGLETACAMRGVAVPDLAGIDLRGAMFDRVQALDTQWKAVPWQQEWRMRFPLAPAPRMDVEAA
jgi:hypothetical protein